MAEVADAGAAGFSDDGLPIRSARVMRRALQYQALTVAQIALHEEDPELSGKGVMHEGEVSALLGMEGIPSVSESTMIARDCALAAYEGARIHVQHLSAAESVAAVAVASAAKHRPDSTPRIASGSAAGMDVVVSRSQSTPDARRICLRRSARAGKCPQWRRTRTPSGASVYRRVRCGSRLPRAPQHLQGWSPCWPRPGQTCTRPLRRSC